MGNVELESFDQYWYPDDVEFVKELPKTTSGKIRRNEIRRMDNNK